jgi:hypothetical protein
LRRCGASAPFALAPPAGSTASAVPADGCPAPGGPLYGIVRVVRARVLAAYRPRRTCVVDPRTGGTVKVIRGTSLLMLLAR